MRRDTSMASIESYISINSPREANKNVTKSGFRNKSTINMLQRGISMALDKWTANEEENKATVGGSTPKAGKSKLTSD